MKSRLNSLLQIGDRSDDLFWACRDDDHPASPAGVFIDEEECFGVDEGFGHIGERFANKLFDLVALPTCDEMEQFVAGPFELVCVGSEKEVEDLGEPHPCERLPTEEACLVERSAERERRRLGNDCLVEIEERCLLHHDRVYRQIAEPT